MRFYVYDPENEIELFHTETEARAAFDGLVERLRDRSAYGWHEDAQAACWGELVPRQWLRLRVVARASDDTPEGAKCRAEGWDFMAEGEVVDVEAPAPDPTADRAQVRALGER